MVTKEEILGARDAALDCTRLYNKWVIESNRPLVVLMQDNQHQDDADAAIETLRGLAELSAKALAAYDVAMSDGVLDAIQQATTRTEPVMVGQRAFATWTQASRVCAEAAVFESGMLVDHPWYWQEYWESREEVRLSRPEEMPAMIELEASAAVKAIAPPAAGSSSVVFENPSRPASLAEVGRLLGMDYRTVRDSTSIRRIEAAGKKWVFDLDEIDAINPDAADKLKPS